MKKTKFAVLFAALIAVLGLSSCLGESDPFVTNTSIFKVSGFPPYIVFEDAYGTKLVPSNQSIFATGIDSRFSLVQYKYDSREVDATSKEISAEVLGYAPVNSINTAYGNEENNAPMYENTSVDSRQLVSLFDKNTLLVNMAYYYKESSGEEQAAELKKHSFYLMEEQPEEGGTTVDDKTLNLCLIHTVLDPQNNKDRTKVGTETRYFDLTSVLKGGTPEIIKIKYKVKSSNGGDKVELVDANKPMELAYKDLVEKYFPSNQF